jgi:hypothetical protein
MITVDTLQAALKAGILDQLCVQAWLGHGLRLFLGFGSDVLPRPWPAPKPLDPPYELATTFTTWSVEARSVVLGTNDDSREEALRACERLVGHRVHRWDLDSTSYELTVHFDSDLVLRVVPWDDADLVGKEAWTLRDPEGDFICVTCDCKLYLAGGDEPYGARP